MHTRCHPGLDPGSSTSEYIKCSSYRFLEAGVPTILLQEIKVHRNKVVVIRRGHASEMVKSAIAKLLNNESVLIDNRNSNAMRGDEIVKAAIRNAKRRGNPVVIEQGSVGQLLEALDFKEYWLFIQKCSNEFLFWYIGDTVDTDPKEHLIAV